MEAFVTRYLLVTGIGAAIVLSAPTLVIIGFFFLLLPGLVMSLLPTAFLYGAVFAVIWWPARWLVGDWPASAAAVTGTALILWTVPTAKNKTIDARIAQDRADDIDQGGKVPLRGIVRIERDDWSLVELQSAEGKAWIKAVGKQRGSGLVQPIACDSLCAAVLFTPGVEAVVLVPVKSGGDSAGKRAPASATFRIDRTSGRSGVVDVASAWPGMSDLPSNGEQLRTAWRTRMSAGEPISREAAIGRADVVVSLTQAFYKGPPRDGRWALSEQRRRVTRLHISDRSGLQLRRTMVETARLVVPLGVEWGGTDSSAWFGWARKWLSEGREAGHFEPLKMLVDRAGLSVTPDAEATAAAARAQLRRLLASSTRSADDPGFALPDAVFDAMRNDGFRPGDHELVEAIVADSRTRQLSGIWRVIKIMGEDAKRLRQPIIRRLLRGTSEPDADRTLGRALAALPRGTFAQSTPEELTLLSDPKLREHAEGLIRRQADRGAVAAPLLLDMLADVFRRRTSAGRQSGPQLEEETVEAIRYALGVLGPEIVAQRPKLEGLLAGRTDRTGRVATWDWEVTLVRMGASPDSFEKPSSRGGSEEEYHISLEKEVRRFERDLARSDQ